jgi:transposase
MKRAVYDRQFKIAAVKLALSEEITVTQVAKQLGINASTLRRWINEYDEYGESAFPGHGNALFNATYEIKKLQKSNEELKLENKLLKKFQAFLKQKNALDSNF